MTAKNTTRRCAWLRRFAKDQSGVAAIEFAAGALVLFMLSMGIIDIGRAMFALNTIEHSSKEGARYAAIHGAQSIAPKTDTEIQVFVENNTSGIDISGMGVVTTWDDPATNAPGTQVNVTVTYPFNFFFGSVFSTAPFNLTAQSTMTISR